MNNNYNLIASNEEKTSDNYLVFQINEKPFAINLKNIVEIISIPAINILPNSPSGIIGVFNYKGNLIKLIDIYFFLGYQTKEFNINNKVIILNINNQNIALTVDSIANIISPDEVSFKDFPFDSETSVIKKIYQNESEYINIIDIDTLKNRININANTKNELDYNLLFPQDDKSQQILKLREDENTKKQELMSYESDINSLNRYVLFTLGNENYYIDLKYVKEFTSTKRLKITKLPYTPDYIKGLINIKGEFLISIDLKNFLNPELSMNDNTNKIIIIEGNKFNIAILVDEIKYIKTINNINPTISDDKNSKYIYAEFVEDNILYNIINIEKIFDDERLYININ